MIRAILIVLLLAGCTEAKPTTDTTVQPIRADHDRSGSGPTGPKGNVGGGWN